MQSLIPYMGDQLVASGTPSLEVDLALKEANQFGIFIISMEDTGNF